MRLFSSLSFRLTLLYALLFAASLALLLGVYYLVSVRAPLEAVKSDIRAEAQLTRAFAGDAASPALVRFLEGRTRSTGGRTPYHVLVAKDGRVLTRNLPSWPMFDGRRWLTIEADTSYSGEDTDHMALVLDDRLPNGARLMIGRDIENLRQRQETLFEAARWLLAGGALFGLLGGILTSRAIGDRIDSINSTARRVMSGDLFERIPTYGSGDDFDRLGETLNVMLTRIQHLLESIRRVSDSVAHELRTPLARLHADLSELSASITPDQRDHVEAAVAETEKLINLFDAVLRIGRVESIRDSVDMAEVDFSALLSDAVEMFGPSAEEKDLRFEAAIAPGLRVMGNRNLLFQAVGNILDNAIKYAPVGGWVELAAKGSSDEVALFIADNGLGIPADERMNVFERFVRLPQASDVPGLGLGLSFVKVVVDAHRSRISFEDANPGVRVCWRLRAVGALPEPALPHEGGQHGPTHGVLADDRAGEGFSRSG